MTAAWRVLGDTQRFLMEGTAKHIPRKRSFHLAGSCHFGTSHPSILGTRMPGPKFQGGGRRTLTHCLVFDSTHSYV